MKNKVKILFVYLMIFLLYSCKNVEKNNNSLNYPVKIVHAFGEVIIKEKPKKIVTIGVSNEDVILALNEIPVGISKVNYNEKEKILPWVKDKYNSLNVDEQNIVVFDDINKIDYNKITKIKPDIIIATYSEINFKEYKKLLRISPVIVYPNKPLQVTWKDEIMITASVLGKVDEGIVLVENIENLIKEKISKFKNIKGKKFILCSINERIANNIEVYTKKDTRVLYLKELGLVLPDEIENIDKNTRIINLTYDEVNKLNMDLIIFLGTKNEFVKLKKVLDSVENTKILFIEKNTLFEYYSKSSPLTIEYKLDEYLEKISKIISK